MSRVTQVARQAEVEVRVLANLPQMLTSRLAVLKVGPAIAVALRPVRLSGPQAAMKRIIDLVGGLCRSAAQPARCGRSSPSPSASTPAARSCSIRSG